MLQDQMDVRVVISQQLQQLVEHLKIMKKLKAIEIKWKFKAMNVFTKDGICKLEDELDSAIKD